MVNKGDINQQDKNTGLWDKGWLWLAKNVLALRSDLAWVIDPAGIRSRKNLQKFHNIHQGESCVVIGNGPSLKKMDLAWLKDQYTFGLNRIYLKFPELGFTTSYYISVNQLVIEQCADDILDIKVPKFLGWYWRDHLKGSPDPIYLRYRKDGTLGFSKNPAWRIWEGATVTYVALQLAYHMGFQKVYLIGVDHHFNVTGEPNKVVVSEGADQDHFDPDYFGKGFRWHLPNLERSEQAYRLAKTAFEEDGREILDATVEGKLDVFPKVDYKTIQKLDNKIESA